LATLEKSGLRLNRSTYLGESIRQVRAKGLKTEVLMQLTMAKVFDSGVEKSCLFDSNSRPKKYCRE
jgi:hypothetical protein